MENRYGVDTSYFYKELESLVRSLENRTPDELRRYLLRLADVAKPEDVSELEDKIIVPCFRGGCGRKTKENICTEKYIKCYIRVKEQPEPESKEG